MDEARPDRDHAGEARRTGLVEHLAVLQQTRQELFYPGVERAGAAGAPSWRSWVALLRLVSCNITGLIP